MFLSREMGKGHGEATHHETQYLSTQSTYFFTILKCFYSYFMCVLPAYVSTKYIHCLRIPGTELQMVVSYHMGAGNQTPVL